MCNRNIKVTFIKFQIKLEDFKVLMIQINLNRLNYLKC